MSQAKTKKNGQNQSKKKKKQNTSKGGMPRPMGAGKHPTISDRKIKEITVASAQAKQAVVKVKQLEQEKISRRKFQMARGSMNFFTSAIDPMHDTSITLAGWPDNNIALSVVRKIPQSFEVKVPDPSNTSYPDGTNWDAHIIFNPWLQVVPMQEQSRSGNCIIDDGGVHSHSNIGGLQIYAAKPGLDFNYGAQAGLSPLNPLIGEITLNPKVSVGVGRLVGVGFEVINNTAPLTVQGTVFCWRAPEPQVHPSTWYYQQKHTIPAPLTPGTRLSQGSPGPEAEITTLQFAHSAQIFRNPPRNIAEAQLYTGTESWHAKEGCYMVGTFTDFENPAEMVNYTMPMIINAQDLEDKTYVETDPSTVNESLVWAPYSVPSIDPVGFSGMPGVKLYPVNQMGAIFAGLSYSSTLTIKLNIYYESFPSLAQEDILTLARPSTRYDERCLRLLANVMRSLPVAVMSKENAEGDWWDRVLEALTLVAPGVLSVFGGEILAPGVIAGLAGIRKLRNG